MSTRKPGKEAPAAPVLLPDFKPAAFMYEGTPPTFPSEQSFKWALRQHRAALADAGALAILRGCMFVHPARFVQVIELSAIDRARGRVVR